MASSDALEPIPTELQTYQFPKSRLKRVMDDPNKTPLCLVLCGSFSPITFLHLRMFEMAADFAKSHTQFEVVGGYFSPVSDAYKKVGLASAEHRIKMCDLAATLTSDWLMVDPWEALQPSYKRTAVVLDHFDECLNGPAGSGGGGIPTSPTGPNKRIQIKLLAGADLIQTMSTPGVWSEADLDHILGRYGSFIVERTGTDLENALSSLQPWKDNIWQIQQLIQNDVSSTKIRLFLRREMSVRYLIPQPVIDYIEEHDLYVDDGQGSVHGDGGGAAATTSGTTSTATAQKVGGEGSGSGSGSSH
ncbi:MAG: hypothetical protein M1824_005077 [Vezdaea acicularis]|nr:MAG: hypothetical protein M1824_005077 [Vezdaea acicularis]